MKIQLFLIALTGFTLGCKSQDKAVVSKDYEIVFDEGLYVERFSPANTSANRYTANNQTYLEGNKLIYDYYYEDLHGERYKFEELEGASELGFRERVKAWSFVRIDSLTERTIEKVELVVEYGLEPMVNNNPDYNQTVISYKYPQVNGERKFSSSTGLIENEKNVWAHPPRDKLFRILEINPFPFIQAPYDIGNQWSWSLKIGSFWGDERWKTWEESIENKYEYEIVGKGEMATPVGALECYEVHSTATSSIGQTHLIAYFSRDIGFVKLDYTNIDSTKIILELVEFEKKGHGE